MFFVKGEHKILTEHTENDFQKRPIFDKKKEKIVDGYLYFGIQAGSFRELRVWKSKEKQKQMQFALIGRSGFQNKKRNQRSLLKVIY